jgi:hypothetical protein
MEHETEQYETPAITPLGSFAEVTMGGQQGAADHIAPGHTWSV